MGLISWIIPLVMIIRYQKRILKNWTALPVISISACAISLCFQIFYHYYLVKIEDWSALMDTMGAVVVAAVVLLVITLILNGITLIMYRGRTAN